MYSELSIHMQILKQKLLSLKCMINWTNSGYRKCKIKTIKIVSSNNNAFCDSPKLFSSNPGNMEPSNILGQV